MSYTPDGLGADDPPGMWAEFEARVVRPRASPAVDGLTGSEKMPDMRAQLRQGDLVLRLAAGRDPEGTAFSYSVDKDGEYVRCSGDDPRDPTYHRIGHPDEGWRLWTGGDAPPVEDGTIVDLYFGDATRAAGRIAAQRLWGEASGIVAYRIAPGFGGSGP